MTTSEMIRAEGKAEGEVTGVAKAILRKLHKRGIAVDTDSRETILACTDIDTLDTWLDRSQAVTAVAGLFES